MNKYIGKIFNIINIIIPLMTFIFVSIITYRSLTYKNRIDTYEEFFTIINNKESDTVEIDYESDIKDKIYNKDTEVSEYISCLNNKLTYEELSDNAKLSIRTLNTLFNQSYNYFAFKYTDIYTGFTVSYNENQEIFTASTIKAPMAIYLYEEAEKGNIDLEEKLTYTSAYYNTGSGVLKYRKFNESYTVRELLSYAIIESDNAAHNMLMNRYGRANMYNFWTNLGTKSIFREYTNWGMTNANDATIYMKELYDFYNKDTELSNELMNNFIKVTYKPLSDKNGNKNTANKSGWSGTAYHDAAIVFDDNPYILVVMSNSGTSDYTYLFNLTSKVVGQLHEEYWNVIYNKCQSIISR